MRLSQEVERALQLIAIRIGAEAPPRVGPHEHVPGRTDEVTRVSVVHAAVVEEELVVTAARIDRAWIVKGKSLADMRGDERGVSEVDGFHQMFTQTGLEQRWLGVITQGCAVGALHAFDHQPRPPLLASMPGQTSTVLRGGFECAVSRTAVETQDRGVLARSNAAFRERHLRTRRQAGESVSVPARACK